VGYTFMLSYCAACKRAFTFNPLRVPSIILKDKEEEGNQPICRPCALRWMKYHPEVKFTIPSDAYEPVDENEIPWDYVLDRKTH